MRLLKTPTTPEDQSIGILSGSAALLAVGAYIPSNFSPGAAITLALTQGLFAR